MSLHICIYFIVDDVKKLLRELDVTNSLISQLAPEGTLPYSFLVQKYTQK